MRDRIRRWRDARRLRRRLRETNLAILRLHVQSLEERLRIANEATARENECRRESEQAATYWYGRANVYKAQLDAREEARRS